MDSRNACTLELLREFWQEVDSIYGVFLDARLGLRLLRREIGSAQKATLRRVDDLTSSSLDAKEILYGKGDPNSPDAVTLHRTTQADFKARIQPGARNESFLGNMCLVTIYHYWEDNYRAKIAESLDMEDKNDLKRTIMGDIRYLRRSIIHNRGIALPDVKNCELLRWFAPGDQITIGEAKLEEIIRRILAYLAELAQQASYA